MVDVDNSTKPEHWAWDEVDSSTRAIVATFAGRVGTIEGWLEPQDYITARIEAFDSSEEDVYKGLMYFGYEGARNAIVNGSRRNRERTAAAIREIGRLAGGTEGTMALAALVEKQIADKSWPYDAIPGLQVLSEMAVARLAIPAVEAS